MRSLDPDVARVECEGIAAFDAVSLEGLQEFAFAFNAGIAYNVGI